jgi:anti-sigma factor RsiW
VACENNERLLHGYFDGELDLVRSVDFEDHLKTCPECAQQLNEMQTIRQSLRAAGLYQRTPASLRSRISAAIPGATEPKVISMPSRRQWRWLAAAAAVVVLLLGARMSLNIGAQRKNLLADEIASNHIRSLLPGHLFDVESSDQHTVKPWFDGKLDFAPPVTDLASQGFPLVGGRLDYLNHRNVAALVYQRQKHLINVFVWPEESRPAKVSENQMIQGYNLVFWTSGGMDFCAVSDLNASELRHFAELLGANLAK